MTWSANQQTSAQNGETDLLDTTPDSAFGKEDSAISLGRTFHDPAMNLYVTPIAVAGVSSNSYIDVVVNVGKFPTNQPPVIASLTSSANNISAGATVTFTVVATDSNNDALAYDWTFEDFAVSPNSAVVSHTFPNPGEYIARCVVSDMKGGLASKSMIITVGTPGTYRIGGIVRDTSFNPVQGIRMDNGLSSGAYRFAYTDSDGRYVIPGFGAGTYTLGGWKFGYHVEPFATSIPVNINNANDLNVNWTVTQLPTVWVSAVTNGVEGGTTSITLSRTGPFSNPNGGLPVIFTTPYGSLITVNTADDGTDFSQTNLIPNNVTVNAVTHTNTVGDIFNYNEVIFPALVTNLTLLFTNYVDATFEGPEVFYLDLAYESQRTFSYTTFSPSTGFQFQTLLSQFPQWGVNFPATDLYNNNPSYYSFSPNTTSSSVLIEPGYVIGAPSVDWPAVTIFDSLAPVLPVVTVAATGNVATESGTSAGELTFTVSQVLTNPLTIFYTVGGTASNGNDYVFLPGSFVIPAGVRIYRFPIFAINDFFVEGPESVDLTITPNANYTLVGGFDTASITIVDDDLPTVTVSAVTAIAVEGGAHGQLSFTRTGNPERSLTINYVVSGTAISGSDYVALSGSVTIPAGAVNVYLDINAFDDGLLEGDETVIIAISDTVFYNI